MVDKINSSKFSNDIFGSQINDLSKLKSVLNTTPASKIAARPPAPINQQPTPTVVTPTVVTPTVVTPTTSNTPKQKTDRNYGRLHFELEPQNKDGKVWSVNTNGDLKVGFQKNTFYGGAGFNTDGDVGVYAGAHFNPQGTYSPYVAAAIIKNNGNSGGAVNLEGAAGLIVKVANNANVSLSLEGRNVQDEFKLGLGLGGAVSLGEVSFGEVVARVKVTTIGGDNTVYGELAVLR